MSTGDEVTSILDHLRGLLGEGTPVTAPLPSTSPADIQTRLDKLPNGLGTVIERFTEARKSQADITAELAQVDPSLVPVIDQSAANVTAGRDDIDHTKQGYVDRRNALAPVERTPAGQMAVLATKVAAVTDGADSLRAQMPPAELRQVLVDELAGRYYQAAKAASQGMGMSPAMASPASPLGAMAGAGSGGGAANPLSALSSLTSAPTSALSSLSSPASSLLNSMAGPLQQLSALEGRGPTAERLSRIPDEQGRRAVLAALSKQGTPYVWGAKGPRFFDCSGLTQWAWSQAGVHLGSDTYSQINEGVRIPPDQVRAGDLIFPLDSFGEGGRRGPGHVQLALSAEQVVHAPQRGDVVRVAPMPARFIAVRPVPASDS